MKINVKIIILIGIIAAQCVGVPIPSTAAANLIAEWRLDEGMGTNISDSSGSGYNGTTAGTVWIAGKAGSALGFTGSSSSYVQISNCSANIGSSFTIATWFKTPRNRGNFGVMLAKGAKGSGHYELYVNTDGRLCFFANDLADISSNILVDDDTWQHAAVTYNSSVVNFYINGELVNSKNVQGTIASSTAALRLGTQVDGTLPYKGQLDEVRIYNTSLSASQILNVYNNTSIKAYYKLDEGSGTSVADSSEEGANGTITNTAWASGVESHALSFNGANSNVDIPNSKANIGSGFTISAWVKVQNTGNFQVMLAKGPKNTGHFEIYISQTGEFKFYSNDIGDYGSSSNINDNIWHHVAVTYDGSTIRFYVDGMQTASANASGTITPETETLKLGSLVDGTLPLSGCLDEVRIYNRTLSGSDISDSLNRYARAYWKFDEISGSTASDSSPNGYNGAVYGATWVGGKVNNAASFDGIDDYIQVANCSANIGSNFTITGWVKAQSKSGYQIVLAKGPKNTGHYEIYLTTSGELRFYSNDIGDYGSGTVITDDIWHHIAVTYDGSHMCFYVDGSLKSSPSAAGAVANETETLRLGTLVDGTYAYKGLLDDVKIYYSKLSSIQIQQLFALGTAPRIPTAGQAWSDSNRIVGTGATDEYYSDFTLIKDTQNRWHAIGCGWDSGDTSQWSTMYHWIGNNLTQMFTKYTPIGSGLTPTPAYMFAPFAVWNDQNTCNMYYANSFYGWGNYGEMQLRLLVSSGNLNSWTPYSGSELENPNIVVNGDFVRDACIFWDDALNVYLMYTADDKDNGIGVITARTSTNLMTWTEPVIVLDYTPSQFTGDPESPFVLKRNGYYYLWISDTDYVRMGMYISTNPFNFGNPDNNLVQVVQGHACEIVTENGIDYMAVGAYWPLKTLNICPLNWSNPDSTVMSKVVVE